MGHNELDQPSFTQPLMYQLVDKMVPVAQKYEKELIADGVLTESTVKLMRDEAKAKFEEGYK